MLVDSEEELFPTVLKQERAVLLWNLIRVDGPEDYISRPERGAYIPD